MSWVRLDVGRRGRAHGTPLLLTSSPADAGAGTRAWLAAHPGGAVVVIGGPAAVSEAAAAGVGAGG